MHRSMHCPTWQQPPCAPWSETVVPTPVPSHSDDDWGPPQGTGRLDRTWNLAFKFQNFQMHYPPTSCPLDGAADPRLWQFTELEEEWKIQAGEMMWNAYIYESQSFQHSGLCMCLGRSLNKRSIQMNGNIQHDHLFIILATWASTSSKQAPPGTSVCKIKQLFTHHIAMNVLAKEYTLWHWIWKRMFFDLLRHCSVKSVVCQTSDSFLF